jgi:hypothetical protein
MDLQNVHVTVKQINVNSNIPNDNDDEVRFSIHIHQNNINHWNVSEILTFQYFQFQ